MTNSNNLDINETKLLSKILISKKKQEPNFDNWLKDQGCIILSLNEFIVNCFNDKRLQEKYFAVKYPPFTYEEYFPSTQKGTWTTTINNKGTVPYSGCITYSDDNYQVLNIILFPKEKVKKILMLDSFVSENHI